MGPPVERAGPAAGAHGRGVFRVARPRDPPHPRCRCSRDRPGRSAGRIRPDPGPARQAVHRRRHRRWRRLGRRARHATAIQTLQKGGNAVDAAVAAAGVLGVVEPFSCGVGGGGFMVIRTPSGKVTTIDARELSPESMRPDSFMEGGTALPFNDARYSGLSAGVPGTVAGWDKALDKYGTFTLNQALQPGIQVAKDGFVVDH